MNPNKPDADKAAEESASLQFNKKYSKDNWTACVISFKAGVAWQSSQSGKERAALEKYGQHLPTCNINQDWSEAYDAMANIPNNLRYEGYYEALEEIEEKRKKCTCGFEQTLSGKQEDQEALWTKIILDAEDYFVKGVITRREFIEKQKSKFSITTK